MAEGWTCPRCHRNLAPWIAHCNCIAAGTGAMTSKPAPGMCEHSLLRGGDWDDTTCYPTVIDPEESQ